VVHVTDLHVLRDICAFSTDAVASQQMDELIFASASRTRVLALSLRLPLPVFEALDGQHSEPPSEETKALASLWSSIWPQVALMSDLRHVRVEIDHTDLSSWSVVNERRVLAPIASFIQATKISIMVVLPKLHPRYETQNRHFREEDTDSLSLCITRRVRQKCHAWRDYKGTWLITRSRYDTFPMTVFFTSEFPELNPAEDYHELEQGELERWKRGEDPTDWVRSRLTHWYIGPPHEIGLWLEPH